MKLSQYEKKLREQAEKARSIKIPSIPENIDSNKEVLFLEGLLNANGKDDVEKRLWAQYGNSIEDLPVTPI